GYYSQQLEDLDDRNEVIMELRRVAPATAAGGELRSFLAKFLFTGDDVYKHVRDLSGGEKGRLALAKLIYSRVNVLVLDEPTNHLDIPSREALEEALDAYQGTIITISHNRYFLDRVATQILALDGEEHAEHYDGDYTEYHDWKAGLAGTTPSKHQDVLLDDRYISTESGGGAEPGEPKLKPAKSGADTGSKRSRKAKSAEQTSTRVKVIKKARSPELIEAEIVEVERRLSALSEEMSKPEVARNISELVKVNDDYQASEQRLAELLEEWERAATTAT